MNFALRLKQQRKKMGLTQAQLAKKLDVSERQIQNLEAGLSKPSFDNLIMLADFFGVSLDYLAGRADK